MTGIGVQPNCCGSKSFPYTPRYHMLWDYSSPQYDSPIIPGNSTDADGDLYVDVTDRAVLGSMHTIAGGWKAGPLPFESGADQLANKINVPIRAGYVLGSDLVTLNDDLKIGHLYYPYPRGDGGPTPVNDGVWYDMAHLAFKAPGSDYNLRDPFLDGTGAEIEPKNTGRETWAALASGGHQYRAWSSIWEGDYLYEDFTLPPFANNGSRPVHYTDCPQVFRVRNLVALAADEAAEWIDFFTLNVVIESDFPQVGRIGIYHLLPFLSGGDPHGANELRFDWAYDGVTDPDPMFGDVGNSHAAQAYSDAGFSARCWYPAFQPEPSSTRPFSETNDTDTVKYVRGPP